MEISATLVLKEIHKALLYSRTIDYHNNQLKKELELEKDVTPESRGFSKKWRRDGNFCNFGTEGDSRSSSVLKNNRQS